MESETAIIMALVRRLGGSVELTKEELDAAAMGGFHMVTNGDGSVRIGK